MSRNSLLTQRLVSACRDNDLPSAQAAIADGASINDWEEQKPAGVSVPGPLKTAVMSKQRDLVAFLLSHGADPNRSDVMYCSVRESTPDILQLLIDAGGDVNQKFGVAQRPLLFSAVLVNDSESVPGTAADFVRVLLAEPSLDLDAKLDDKTPEMCAFDAGKPALGDLIAHEVKPGFSLVRSRSASSLA